MDYDQLSDFEINTAVFETLYGGTPDYKEGDNGAMVIISYEGDIVGGDAVEVEVERGVFNPCNNPTDAWSIMIDNNIGLEKEFSFCCSECGEYYDTGRWEVSNPDAEHCCTHKNPLRAAMIVFLMMRESNKKPS